jgi:hypothetical protein
MYSFPGANHNLRRKCVRERTKLYNISIIAMVFSLCLAQQAQAGEVTISNRNCAWRFPIGIAPGKDYPELTRPRSIFAGWQGLSKEFLTLRRCPTRVLRRVDHPARR